MKTSLIVAMLIAATVATVSAQSPSASATFTAPVGPTQPRHRPPPPISQKPTVDGVIPRAIRGGNPAQMLNPRAPRKYGTSQEAVTYDQDDPYKWRGIKLFEIRF